MTYTYDDVITAKDIVTGRVKEEDIIGKKGIFIDSIPDDMSLNTLLRAGCEGKLIKFTGSYMSPFWGDNDTKWIYFIPDKEESPGLRFKVGDRVKHNHGIATVVKVDKSDPELTYRIQFEEGGLLWVRESNISPAEDEPAYIPFDLLKPEDRDFLRGKWVRRKNVDELWEDQILSFGSQSGHKDPYAAMNMTAERADALLKYYEFLDGSPIGKRANKEEA